MASLLMVNVMDLLLASPVVIQRICRIDLCTSLAIHRKEADVKFSNKIYSQRVLFWGKIQIRISESKNGS